ncbi:MAG: hypothetical protein A3F16_08090 [Deltaproteobacteria bacterium RIFCSPHIGHO2_12_FULL_43_9]|nr:MAG: hypothetical protein A3F16_08090 [Deltaproteobacteria bacterium RIFCSPHIGHO2_12_FULL_43_9]
MIRCLAFLLSFLFVNICFAAFETGDVLLQSARCGVYCDSIRASTKSPIDHAAIVVIPPKKSLFSFILRSNASGGEVVEAWTPVTKRTPLLEFLARDGGKYIQLRLKPEYRNGKVIDAVIKVANSYVGKEYDYHFEESEDKIYCSELVYKAYDKGAGIHAGKMQKISDFDKKIAEAYWKEHFQGHIPWERDVISPAGLLMTDKFDVVYSGYPTTDR